jgi:hypothetical protein
MEEQTDDEEGQRDPGVSIFCAPIDPRTRLLSCAEQGFRPAVPLGGERQRNEAGPVGAALRAGRLSSEGSNHLLALACPIGELLRQLRMPLPRGLGHCPLRRDPLFRCATKVKTLVRFHYPALRYVPMAHLHNLPGTSYRVVNIHSRTESSARRPVAEQGCGVGVTKAAIQLNDETERLTARSLGN